METAIAIALFVFAALMAAVIIPLIYLFVVLGSIGYEK